MELYKSEIEKLDVYCKKRRTIMSNREKIDRILDMIEDEKQMNLIRRLVESIYINS